MDQYLSTVIISIITGIFSLITLLIQKKQDKVISKIDNQTVFIEREKMLKQKLLKKQAEQEDVLNNILVIIMDTNLHILRNTMIAGATIPDEKVFEKSEELKNKFLTLLDEIEELNKQYDMLLSLSAELKSSDIKPMQEQVPNKK